MRDSIVEHIKTCLESDGVLTREAVRQLLAEVERLTTTLMSSEIEAERLRNLVDSISEVSQRQEVCGRINEIITNASHE